MSTPLLHEFHVRDRTVAGVCSYNRQAQSTCWVRDTTAAEYECCYLDMAPACYVQPLSSTYLRENRLGQQRRRNARL